MGTPLPKDRLAATYDWCGQLIQTIAYDEFDPKTTRVLDIGAGWGKYRDLLPDFWYMDAVEIWEPYVEQHRLKERYFEVRVESIVTAIPLYYDLYIFGDVLEHLSRWEAEQVLEAIFTETDAEILVAVPYLHPQGEEEGNPYEEHIQDDLTPEVMALEYPQLRLVAMESHGIEPFKGLYRRAR